MKALLSRVKSAALTVLAYLGDAAHRRAVATAVALISTHLIGYALDADRIALGLEIGIGAFSGAWSSRTPQLPEQEGGE